VCDAQPAGVCGGFVARNRDADAFACHVQARTASRTAASWRRRTERAVAAGSATPASDGVAATTAPGCERICAARTRANAHTRCILSNQSNAHSSHTVSAFCERRSRDACRLKRAVGTVRCSPGEGPRCHTRACAAPPDTRGARRVAEGAFSLQRFSFRSSRGGLWLLRRHSSRAPRSPTPLRVYVRRQRLASRSGAREPPQRGDVTTRECMALRRRGAALQRAARRGARAGRGAG
jgi:hypothetical protein